MSLGSELKSLREAKGLSVVELSEISHASSDLIRNFEDDNFSNITAAIYGRAFVKKFSDILGGNYEALKPLFEAEYREWQEANRVVIPAEKPPLKFSDRPQIKQKPNFTESIANESAKVEDKPEKPIKKTVPSRRSARAVVREEAQPVKSEYASELFADPKPVEEAPPLPTRKPMPIPEKVEEPPVAVPIADVSIDASVPPKHSEPPRRVVSKPIVFNDELSHENRVDFKKFFASLSAHAKRMPLKYVGYGACALILIGLIVVMLVSGGESDTIEADNEDIETETSLLADTSDADAEADEASVAAVSYSDDRDEEDFSDKAIVIADGCDPMTQYLIPPPDTYFE